MGQDSKMPPNAARRLPARLQWAVERTKLHAGDRVLEIGCAGGAFMASLCPRLGGGHITGIDASAGAVARAAGRLAEELRRGTASLYAEVFAHTRQRGPYDLIVAINVNAFWRHPAENLRTVSRLLAPTGRLYLYNEQATPDRLTKAEDGCLAGLRAANFTILAVERKRGDRHEISLIVAAPPEERRKPV